MKPFWALGVGVATAAALAGSVQAQSAGPGRFSLGVGVGTNGGLVEGAWRVTDQFVLRGQGAFLSVNYGFTSGDIRYDGRFRFNTGGAFVDWHPMSGPWLLTAGAIDGERKVNLSAKPSLTGSITIHGVVYPVTQVSSVVGDVDYGNIAPEVGLGWDNTFYARSGWGVRAIAAVAFGDHPPSTHLQAQGPFASNATVVANVQAEQAKLQSRAADYSYYPVVQVGLNYRF